jgi:hypothetical protein
LARYLADRSDLSEIAVISVDAVATMGQESGQLTRIMARYGFEASARPPPLPIAERPRGTNEAARLDHEKPDRRSGTHP